MRSIVAVDMFCGAGGTSTGLAQACEKLGLKVNLTAINHWKVAIASHAKNHPWARHINSNIEKLDPFEVVPGRRIDLLVASPECRHHSTARGGRPINDQKRASAWYILRWVELLYVKNILIENVPEFRKWGPVNSKGKRIKSLEGTTYKAFIGALVSLGYRVEERIINHADNGDATTRKRLFIIARRHRSFIPWPKASHSKARWKPAKKVIDWSLPGISIFRRKEAGLPPLAAKTIERIAEGIKKFAGPWAAPFLEMLKTTGRLPLEPFILGHRQFKNDCIDSVGKPMRTITGGSQDIALAQPFIINLEHYGGNGKNVRSIDDPTYTISTKTGMGVAVPFIVPNFGERPGQKPRSHSVDNPLPAPTGHGAGALVAPFVLPRKGFYQSTGNVPRSVDKPIPTATSRGAGFLVAPHVVKVNHGKDRTRKGTVGRRSHSLKSPLPTLTTHNGMALVAPMLVKYFGTGQAKLVTDPVPTLTTKARAGLCLPLANGEYAIDILFRMLTPGELAAAMSFPKDYEFTGRKEDIVKQIGNAVGVKTARALCMAILKEEFKVRA